MPPSAGACHTTLAAERPDCGRASNWSSIWMARTCRFATFGETSIPVSGAATRTGVGAGVGVGSGVAVGATVGAGDSLAGVEGASDVVGAAEVVGAAVDDP